ncbi:MAG: hypothetical protein LBQ42_11440 [Synergistaceae bacterium]|jgi:hypothetical protein|nr:hypothetical protein [Synergistaceae bacterium]
MKHLTLFLCFFLAFSFATPVFADDEYKKEYTFYNALWEPIIKFIESGNHNETLVDGRTAYYQGVDTSVAADDGLDSTAYLAFFTKDKNMKFPGNIKIGGGIDQVIKSGQIPGNYSQEPAPNSKGVYHHWSHKELEKELLLITLDGKIIELVFYDGVEVAATSVEVDAKLLAYLSDAASGSSANPSKQKQTEQGATGQISKQSPAPPQQKSAQKGTPNTSTDSDVITSYSMSPQDKNILGIQHRAAYSMYSKKSYRRAYEAFSKLADDYQGNYLSAYWAGMSALRLNKKQDAAAWFDRALQINPHYQPAIDERAKRRGE